MEARRPAARAENLMKYTAIVQGQNVEIELNRKPHGVIEAEISGRRYTLQGKSVEPGVYWLVQDNQSLEIGVSQTVEGYIVSLLGRRIPVEILDTRAALRRAAQQDRKSVV